MEISSVSSSSSSQYTSSEDYTSKIKKLETQEKNIQKKIDELNGEDNLSQAQQEMQASYEQQLEAIQAQISQLEQQQAQAAQKSSSDQSSSTKVSQNATSTDSLPDDPYVGNNINVKA